MLRGVLEQGWPVGKLLGGVLWAVVAAVLGGLHPRVGFLSLRKEAGPALSVSALAGPIFIQSVSLQHLRQNQSADLCAFSPL